MTLTEFLLARIAEDQEHAGVLERYSGLEVSSYRDEWTGQLRKGGPVTVGEVSPARMKAECEAKRRIVAKFAPALNGYSDLLALLALPYADHPDYREEWQA